jgi:hypothetical protein
MSLTVGGALVAAFLSPIVFGVLLLLRGGDGSRSPSGEPSVEHGEPSHED